MVCNWPVEQRKFSCVSENLFGHTSKSAVIQSDFGLLNIAYITMIHSEHLLAANSGMVDLCNAPGYVI